MAINEHESLTSESVSAQPRQSKANVPVPIIAGVVFGVLLLAGIWWMAHPSAQKADRPSAESLAYLSQIQLTDFHMSHADNIVGANLIYLDGKVANNGTKTIGRLQVWLYFHDAMNQVVLRDAEDIIRPSAAPLAPGETRDFQLRFDRVPSSWNYQPPDFTLAALEFK